VPKVIGDSVNVHPLWVLFGVMAASALYGIMGALFALPAIAIISAVLAYLRETLLFEPWRKPPVSSAGTPSRRRDRVVPRTPPEAREDGSREPSPTPDSAQPPSFPGDRRGKIGE
jgi:hypothetical protein